MRKEHSIHNEKVCDLLLKDGNYNDWVVTAAFYSALHLVLHQIFPLKIGKIDYNNFNRYYFNVVKKYSNSKSKHQAIKDLVVNNLNECSNSYRWLFDNCMSARYNNYKVSKPLAIKARNELDKIKSICTKT